MIIAIVILSCLLVLAIVFLSYTAKSLKDEKVKAEALKESNTNLKEREKNYADYRKETRKNTESYNTGNESTDFANSINFLHKHKDSDRK